MARRGGPFQLLALVTPAAADNTQVIGNGQASCAPAIHEDTLVHTARGLIEAQHLIAEDMVFTLDLVTKAILPTLPTTLVDIGSCQLIEVRVGTRTIRVTPDATFLALVDRRRPGRIRRRFKQEWIRAGDLKAHDIVGVARKTPDLGVVRDLPCSDLMRDRRARGVKLPIRPDDDLMWWIGLYIGDGFVHHSGHRKRVEFAIPATQPDVRLELIAVTASLFGVQARAKDEWRVVVPGIRIVDFVEAIGLGGTALRKRIPHWVYSSPESHRMGFLGGYVDADGDVRAPGKRARNKDMGLTSGNPALLEDARRLAVMCGVRTSSIWDFTSRHPFDRTRTITGYRMRFSGDFDRIPCRSERRIIRMHQRKYFHNNTSVANLPLRSHASEWLGFARVESVSLGGVHRAFVVPAERLVVEGVVVGLAAEHP